jgi:hypothetical protein
MTRFLSHLVTRLTRWLRDRFRLRQFKGPEFCGSEADHSPGVKARRLVIVGPKGKPKWLRFMCPCRCGDEIALNLMDGYSPKWTILLHPDETLTVTPSVDAKKCGSHFWLRNNRVYWV